LTEEVLPLNYFHHLRMATFAFQCKQVHPRVKVEQGPALFVAR